MNNENKLQFIEAMLNWFASPSMGRELDVKFLSDAYDDITSPAWVSVEERLPKETGKTQQSINVWATDGLTSGEFRYNFDTKTWTDIWGDPFDITHWMPLPTKPVKKGGQDAR